MSFTRGIERLEGRVLMSASVASGTHLVWSGGISTGIAHEAIAPAITVELEDTSGNVANVSGVTATLKINGSGGDRILGRAVIENGVGTLSGILPTKSGKYRLSAAVGRLRISSPFVVEGGPGATMKLIGFAYLNNGDQGFTVKLRDRFGNLATSDNSILFFKVAKLAGTLESIGIPLTNPGVVFAGNNEGVQFGAQEPGFAFFEIDAIGFQQVGQGGATEAIVSVTLYDSNPAIRPITSPTWMASS